MKKVSVIAAAVAASLAAGSAFAAGTDAIKDGWDVHGYASMNSRLLNGRTVDTEFGKPDYKTAGTHGKSTNQVEFVVKKNTTHENGVWSLFNLRAEYGNGNSYAYTSEGAQKKNTDSQFEIKETYIELGGISFLGDDTSIWAGQRFLNRSAGLLSGEYWRQSSGVGAGLQTKLAGNTAGYAVVTADTNESINNGDPRQTLVSNDFYYYGVDVGFGSLDFDFKYMRQSGKGSDANDGFGASITLNSNYYGLDGWSQTAIAYGKGVAQNRGVNFGGWSGGDDNAESIFFTTYGVLNISDNWQLGSELTYFAALDQLFGAEDLERYIVAVRPSYKVNDNLRLEMTGSYAHEEGKDGYWGRTGDAVKSDIINLELAAAFTVNADYFGRPQIKPYVSHIIADDKASAAIIGINDSKSETIFGVHAEIWF
ncbi:carbohydrate porin [Vibrio metschnikovii]|nr:carbohydrate porin [Vibrio metschnikovii]EKO3717234.1 carbohydrate porin [Vibrio metschnikovii]EKO3734571.1 carbohydrate porin [Vibrio metschnikovii]EKO3745220.1 carbohydrate porin [Vibrio metschnikovii]